MPLVTCAQAERAAESMLLRWPGLRLAVVTSRVAHVVRERTNVPPSASSAAEEDASLASRSNSFYISSEVAPKWRRHPRGDGGGGSAQHRTFVLPRRHLPSAHMMGALDSDAFVGGFIAAQCRWLSTPQSLLWGHAAHCVARLRCGRR